MNQNPTQSFADGLPSIQPPAILEFSGMFLSLNFLLFNSCERIVTVFFPYLFHHSSSVSTPSSFLAETLCRKKWRKILDQIMKKNETRILGISWGGQRLSRTEMKCNQISILSMWIVILLFWRHEIYSHFSKTTLWFLIFFDRGILFSFFAHGTLDSRPPLHKSSVKIGPHQLFLLKDILFKNTPGEFCSIFSNAQHFRWSA